MTLFDSVLLSMWLCEDRHTLFLVASLVLSSSRAPTQLRRRPLCDPRLFSAKVLLFLDETDDDPSDMDISQDVVDDERR